MYGRKKRAFRVRHDALSRDQLARWAMQMAPEHLFEMLAMEASDVDDVRLGEAIRLDTQAARHPWRVDGLYVRTVGPQRELWLVEMQTRATRRRSARTSGLLRAAFRQLDRAVEDDESLRVFLVEVRTGQAARARRTTNTVGDVDGETREDCGALAPIGFVATNRLLVTGPWTQVLLAHPPAWPLWAFGRQVTSDAILGLVATIDPNERYAGSVAALLRAIGRVRFPGDERFWRVPEEETETMAQALAQLEEDGRITAEEREERVRQYLARLDEQEQRHVERGRAQGWEQGRQEGREQGRQEGREQGRQEGREQGRQEGREQGRREALLALLGSADPDSADALAASGDLNALEEAVRRLLVRDPAAD